MGAGKDQSERRPGATPDSNSAGALDVAQVRAALERIEGKLSEGWRVPVAVALISGLLALAGTWVGSRLTPRQEAATIFAQEAARFYTRGTELVRRVGDGVEGLCQFGNAVSQAQYDAVNADLESLYVAIRNHRGKVRTDVVDALAEYNEIAASTIMALHQRDRGRRETCEAVRTSRRRTEAKLEEAIANIGRPL